MRWLTTACVSSRSGKYDASDLHGLCTHLHTSPQTKKINTEENGWELHIFILLSVTLLRIAEHATATERVGAENLCTGPGEMVQQLRALADLPGPELVSKHPHGGS